VTANQAADVLIVGSGAAGVCAAIEASAAGARVLVVESYPTYGGTAAVAGAGCAIAGSPLQERLGIDDSPARAFEDWLAWGGPEVDVEWARRYIEASVPELYVWLAGLGVEWLSLNWNEGNSVPRWHSPRNAGLGVMEKLYAHARSFPIEWEFSTRATELRVEGGRVVGLAAERTDGQEVEFRAESVLMATGGFNNNLEMVRQNANMLTDETRILLGGGRGALGQGHKLLERVDAQFVNMGAVWMYPYSTPDYRDMNQQRGLVVRGLEGHVWVHRAGRR
jgi:succinate dehydrogenase/fumarate reductase flavoprotein subunit